MGAYFERVERLEPLSHYMGDKKPEKPKQDVGREILAAFLRYQPDPNAPREILDSLNQP